MEKEVKYKHFPRAQMIVHDCLDVLGDQRVYRFGKGVVKRTNGIKGACVIEITLDGIGVVFKAEAQASTVKTISYPNTRFATPNTHGVAIHSVSVLRDGIWRKKLRERADHYRQKASKDSGNFDPVDDADLWEQGDGEE